MGVGEFHGEVRQHEVEHPGIDRGGRLIVEIDRAVRTIGGARRLAAHLIVSRRVDRRRHAAARPWRRARPHQAARKPSTSDSVLSQPRLTRMAQPAASAATPMAPSTWDARTLPEEQAEPLLTATPARSSAITWVSAATPARPMQLVFASRATPAP